MKRTDIGLHEESRSLFFERYLIGVRQVRVSGLHGLCRSFGQGRDRTGDVPEAC